MATAVADDDIADSRPALMPRRTPAALRARPQWVLWRYEERDGKPTKVPYRWTRSGRRLKASSTDPKTWSTAPKVAQRFAHSPDFDGIGFVFAADDPYTGVDLDGCRDPVSGKLEAWAQRYVDLLKSYTEVSPSGTGVKIWIAARKPARLTTESKQQIAAARAPNVPAEKHVEVEIYDRGRYFAVTGWRLEGTPEAVYDRQAELERLCNELWPPKAEAPPKAERKAQAKAAALADDDDALLERAFRAKNGDAFKRLWDGATGDHGGDHSRSRMALLCRLAYWTAKDATRMRRLYERSGLHGQRADKWDRLADQEIGRACETVTEVYEPRARDAAAKGKRREKPSPAELGAEFLAGHHAVAARGELCIYDRGAYRAGGDAVVRRWVQGRLGKDARKRDGDELCYWLRTDRCVDDAALDPADLVNVDNGLLDWRTGELRPHTPDVLSTVQLPTRWQADAYEQRCDRFLDEVLPDAEARAVVEEFAGYCLWPDCRFQKALMLTGCGENGKSKFIEWLAATIGAESCSTLRLQDLDSRFRTHELLGKLVNLCADLPRKAVDDSGTFKMLVTGDAVTAEQKFRDPVSFANRAKLIFSANELPGTSDRSAAYFRRWIVVDFPSLFQVPKPGEALPPGVRPADPTLPDRLCSAAGRSYLLRLAVEGLRRLVARGHFQETEAMRQAVAEYRRQADHIVAFYEERCRFTAEHWTTKRSVFSAYLEWAKTTNNPPVSENIFARRLLSIEPRLRTSRRGGRDSREYVYDGLELVSGFEPPEPGYRGTRWSA